MTIPNHLFSRPSMRGNRVPLSERKMHWFFASVRPL